MHMSAVLFKQPSNTFTELLIKNPENVLINVIPRFVSYVKDIQILDIF